MNVIITCCLVLKKVEIYRNVDSYFESQILWLLLKQKIFLTSIYIFKSGESRASGGMVNRIRIISIIYKLLKQFF